MLNKSWLLNFDYESSGVGIWGTTAVLNVISPEKAQIKALKICQGIARENMKKDNKFLKLILYRDKETIYWLRKSWSQRDKILGAKLSEAEKCFRQQGQDIND